MATKSCGGSRFASILAVQVMSNAINGARNGAERAFRHRSYRSFRIERELLQLPPESVSLHFFDRNPQHDQTYSEVISPRINRNGRIDQWPEGFFDEWDKSLEALLGP